jgi:hypothetical protein
MPTPITPIFESYAELNAFLTAETPSRIYPLYNAGQGGSDAGIIGHMRYSAEGSRMVGEWDWTKVTDSDRATVDGAQGPVTTITVASGHTLADSDVVSIKSGGVFVALHRTLSSVSDTSLTISGAGVTVADGAEVILEGVPSALTSLIAPESGGVVLFDSGLVTSLALTQINANISGRTITAEMSVMMEAEGQVLLNGTPGNDSYFGCGYRHNSAAEYALAINGIAAGVWECGAVISVGTISLLGHATGTPGHEEVRKTSIHAWRPGTDDVRYVAHVLGASVTTGNAQTAVSGDNLLGDTDFLPFAVGAIPDTGESLAWRVQNTRHFWDE